MICVDNVVVLLDIVRVQESTVLSMWFLLVLSGRKLYQPEQQELYLQLRLSEKLELRLGEVLVRAFQRSQELQAMVVQVGIRVVQLRVWHLCQIEGKGEVIRTMDHDEIQT